MQQKRKRPPDRPRGAWIGIRLDIGGNDWDHIGELLQRNWRMGAPKKLTALHDVAGAF